MVLRNEEGTFIAARTSVIPSRLSSKEGEIQGLLQAFDWVRSLGYSRTIFEVDAKAVVDAVLGQAVDMTVFGYMVKSCRLVLQLERDFSLYLLGGIQMKLLII
ncbi:hypothetical protein PTKIN_Ptkin01aG0258300 [Pterospermum kingtungense]